MLPVRTCQMGQGLPDPTSAPDVDSRQWSDAVSRTLMAERVVPAFASPRPRGYLADLSRARVAALDGKDPEAALREVSRPGPREPRLEAPNASSGTIAAASTAWPRFPNLPSGGNDRNAECRNAECRVRICHLPFAIDPPHSGIWPSDIRNSPGR